jgi:ABC-type polysaccharide/polyol phosphate transport system ATPase subunit
MIPPAVCLEQVWVTYRRRGWRRQRVADWALSDVSVTVPAGEMLGLIGPNGSGKTTILQTVAGVLRPTSGQLSTQGKISSLVDLAAGVHRDLTGHENLLIGGVLLGLSRAQVRARYDEIVDFAGLSQAELEAPLRTYSAGMGLRLAISLVLQSDPSVLLVDEVLAVGDAAFQAKCIARVQAFQERGCGVVVASHDLDLVRQRCNSAAVLLAGRVDFHGPPAEAIDRCAELNGGAALQEPQPAADLALYAPRLRTWHSRHPADVR